MATCPDWKKWIHSADPSKPRAIELTMAGLKAIGAKANAIPMLGVVTAGEPILAVEEASDFFPIPPELQNESDDLFMLRIKGDSMINAESLMVTLLSFVNNLLQLMGDCHCNDRRRHCYL